MIFIWEAELIHKNAQNFSIPYLGDPVGVCGDVAQVPRVPLPLLAVLAAVLALVQVEVRPGRGAAVGLFRVHSFVRSGKF